MSVHFLSQVRSRWAVGVAVLTCACGQPTPATRTGPAARSSTATNDYRFDISRTSDKIVLSSSPEIGKGKIEIMPKPADYLAWSTDGILQVEGSAPIFGISDDNVVYIAAGYVEQKPDSAGIQWLTRAEKLRTITVPPTGAKDFLSAFSQDRNAIFFLRSLGSRSTSMGGRALGQLDLWSVSPYARVPKQLTHFSMFTADLSPRAALKDSVVFVGWAAGWDKERLERVFLKTGAVKTIAESPSNRIGGYSVSDDGKWVYFSADYFPSTIYKVPINGGAPTKITQANVVGEMIAKGNFLYYITNIPGGSTIKKLNLTDLSTTDVAGTARTRTQ